MRDDRHSRQLPARHGPRQPRPLTGRKRYKSKIIRGTGRAAWKEARKVEGRMRKAPKSFTVAQLLDQWLKWRETNGKEISPSALYNYRLTIDTKIKPGLGHLAVAEVDARVLDRFYAALRKSGNARFPSSRLRYCKDPKSGNSERVIALDTRTVALLKAHHAHCAERALATGVKLPDSAFLFAREADGSRPVRPDAMTRRFKEIAEGLSHSFTLHGLRHFVATELGAVAEAGTVKSRLGHGSLAVSSIYTHRVSKADRDAAKHMGKVLDGRPARSRQRPKTG